MRNPCGMQPELWTSEYAEERAVAAEACTYCPRKTACHDAAVEAGESWGVWGGHDFSRSKPYAKTKATTTCTNRERAAPLMFDGTRRRYCSDKCQNRESHLRQKDKRAVA